MSSGNRYLLRKSYQNFNITWWSFRFLSDIRWRWFTRLSGHLVKSLLEADVLEIPKNYLFFWANEKWFTFNYFLFLFETSAFVSNEYHMVSYKILVWYFWKVLLRKFVTNCRRETWVYYKKCRNFMIASLTINENW